MFEKILPKRLQRREKVTTQTNEPVTRATGALATRGVVEAAGRQASLIGEPNLGTESADQMADNYISLISQAVRGGKLDNAEAAALIASFGDLSPEEVQQAHASLQTIVADADIN